MMSFIMRIQFVILYRRGKQENLYAHYNAIFSANQPLVGFIVAQLYHWSSAVCLSINKVLTHDSHRVMLYMKLLFF